MVIITGSGEKAFVAGSDIAEMQPQNSIEIRGVKVYLSGRICQSLGSKKG